VFPVSSLWLPCLNRLCPQPIILWRFERSSVITSKRFTQLKLAPPYESVEKAIRSLTTSVHALPPSERARLACDATARWQHFRQAFESSGLSKKHRGIIAGLARNRSGLNLPAEYDQFLNLYLS
jgi:hypothetical protein